MPTPVTLEILQTPDLQVAMKFVGSNTVGPQLTIVLPTVNLAPGGAFKLIAADEWTVMELEGEVLVDIATGSFGQVTHPDTGITSPITTAYEIGRGVLSIKLATDGDYVDCGNVSAFDITPSVKRLDHFSSRGGIRRKDASPIVEASCTVKATLDEMTARNLQMYLLAS